MTPPIILPATAPCGCRADHMTLGPHYLGPTAADSAILDLAPFAAPEDVALWASHEHPKSIGYSLRRAMREGYVLREFGGTKRNPEIAAINSSRPIRQGRPMSASYLQKMVARPGDTDEPLARACDAHFRTMYGCFTKDDVLAAYVSFVRSGPLGILSRLLAHRDYQKDGAMHAVLGFTLAAAKRDGAQFVMYGGAGDGQLGLKAFKRRWGFAPRKLVLA